MKSGKAQLKPVVQPGEGHTCLREAENIVVTKKQFEKGSPWGTPWDEPLGNCKVCSLSHPSIFSRTKFQGVYFVVVKIV